MAEAKINAEKKNEGLNKKPLMSLSPHVRSKDTTRNIMLNVIIALIPAILGSIYYFRLNAVKLIITSVVSAVIFEALIQKAFKKEVRIYDLSAVVTGLLFAMTLPATTPLWMVVFGSGFAIIVVKEFFGGIGSNFMNPALAARAALVASWPTIMSEYVNPDMKVTATPLALMEAGNTPPSIQRMFLGDIAGSLGETSALLLLIGAAYLLVKRIIDWKIPVSYIATTALMLLILGVSPDMIIYHLLSGGLILGAFFMATDYSSSPITSKGKIVFGIGAGILTAIIRIKGGMAEGVCYSILLMNAATPLIERFTKPKAFGEVK